MSALPLPPPPLPLPPPQHSGAQATSDRDALLAAIALLYNSEQTSLRMHQSHGFSKKLFIEALVNLRRVALQDPRAAFGEDGPPLQALVCQARVALAAAAASAAPEEGGAFAEGDSSSGGRRQRHTSAELAAFAAACCAHIVRAAGRVVAASSWLAPGGSTGAADLRRPESWYPLARSMKRRVVYHAGPTNSGKTYNALAALKEAWSGVYCGPLRLLALEVYESLNLDGAPCSLLTGQERRIIPFAGHVSCTVEMLSTEQALECAVIDEIQLIGDEHRGASWTRALLGVPAHQVHVCGDPAAIPAVEALCRLTGDSFEIRHYQRMTSIVAEPTSLEGDYGRVAPGDAIIAFSRKDIYAVRRAVERFTPHKCCVVYGSLPPETRSAQARLFNDPSAGYRVLVASDAVGMGLNLNIRRVVFHTMEKFDGVQRSALLPAQIKQIAGRAGRRSSIYPNGFATTLNATDLPALQAALAEPPGTIAKAGLFPNSEQLIAFSAQLPLGLPFCEVIARFLSASQLDGPYFMCRGEEMISIAVMLERYAAVTTLEQFSKLCLLPANLRQSEVRLHLFKFLDQFVRGHPVRLDLQLPLDDPVYLMQEIGSLEHKVQALEIYLWLTQRLGPVAFVDAAEAAAKRRQVSHMLGTALTSLSKSAKEGKWAVANAASPSTLPPRQQRLWRLGDQSQSGAAQRFSRPKLLAQ
jgi:ATP-dependent RNA helicase SUPV3L1/SUV3